MGEYAFWLEHEYCRTKSSPPNSHPRDQWYYKRISWFVNLMEVMEVTTNDIVQRMTEIRIEETMSIKPEKVDKGGIIDHFKTSAERNGFEISGLLAQPWSSLPCLSHS
jgi:hypothetical protein